MIQIQIIGIAASMDFGMAVLPIEVFLVIFTHATEEPFRNIYVFENSDYSGNALDTSMLNNLFPILVLQNFLLFDLKYPN